MVVNFLGTQTEQKARLCFVVDFVLGTYACVNNLTVQSTFIYELGQTNQIVQVALQTTLTVKLYLFQCFNRFMYQ